jgi:hypothetical protein
MQWKKDLRRKSSKIRPERPLLPEGTNQDDPWTGKLKILARGFGIDSGGDDVLGLTGCVLDPSRQQHPISDGIRSEL